ncbi:MAG: dTDP-4-dehydrorhamnose 3,5-epimerase [Planctomycetota bacterium]
MPSQFETLSLPGVVLVTPRVFADARGHFKETFKASEFATAGLPSDFVQENVSVSKKGVVRGLHFQVPPMAQGKLVQVIRGSILDVVVDIRKSSAAYGKHLAVTLTAHSHQMLWVPEGFAHGFASLEDNTEVVYKVTREYAPACDRGILWNDPDLGIDWKTPTPLLSDKDTKHPRLKDAGPLFS